MNKSQWVVSYRIMGLACDPEAITRLLNVPPTKTWRAGDLRHPKAKVVHQESGWELRSAVPPNANLIDHVKALMAALKPAAEKLAKVDPELTRQLYCGLSVHGDERPAMHFSAADVLELGKLGASLDIDIIFYADK